MALLTDPQSIPLPPEDNTNYFSAATPKNVSSESDGDASDGGSAPQTARAKSSFSRPHLANHLYQNMNTPTPAMMPFHVLTPKDMAATQKKPSRRGGKYHPGAAPMTEERRRTKDGIDCHTSEVSEMESGSEDFTSGGEDFDRVEYQNFDQTIPLNLATPVPHRLSSQPYTSRGRHTSGRPSPGRTPRRVLRGNSARGKSSAALETTLTPSFTNPNALPSMFSEENTIAFPYLSCSSPQKLNAIRGTTGIDPYQLSVDNSLLSTQLREKEAKIRQLEEMLACQSQDFGEFVDYSPEKRMKASIAAPDDLQLTVRKRRSPTKLPPVSAKKVRNASRSNSKSPVKAFVGLFENISNGTPVKIPRVTAEEKRRERRRRETLEFREFSAIDLDALKSYNPPPVLEEQAEEENIVQAGANLVEQQQATGPVQESKGVEMEDEDKTITLKAPKPQLNIPPSPVRRVRTRRSNSAPPPPRAVNPEAKKLLPPNPETAEMSSTIAALQARVAHLQDELETASVQLQKAVISLEGERRARLAAEETWRFLEVERKFGVCCHSAAEAGKPEPEVAAYVPLPSSPANSIASHSTFDGRENRPASRMAPYDRSANRSDAYSSKIGTAIGRKRGREEGPQPPQNIAKKPPVPRQEKRVLSGAGPAAANVLLGATSGLKKGPVRVVSGAAAGTRSQMGLSRGTRR